MTTKSKDENSAAKAAGNAGASANNKPDPRVIDPDQPAQTGKQDPRVEDPYEKPEAGHPDEPDADGPDDAATVLDPAPRH